MIDKTKTPILISTPRAGSHYVGQYIRETFKNFGILTPRSSELFNEEELPDGILLNEVIHFFEYACNIDPLFSLIFDKKIFRSHLGSCNISRL